MTLTADIDHRRTALLSLVAMLIAGAQFEDGKPAVLQRILRATVLYSLRPIESAARRLVVVRALLLKLQGYVVTLRPVRVKPGKTAPSPKREPASRGPVFALFDPKRRPRSNSKPRYAKHAPRMTVFGFNDDPRLRPVALPKAPAPKHDDLLDVTGLFHRLLAVKMTLEDLSKPAKRLFQIQARREATGKGRTEAMRRGNPPGHRARGKWQADEALRACHQLALSGLAAPDSS